MFMLIFYKPPPQKKNLVQNFNTRWTTITLKEYTLATSIDQVRVQCIMHVNCPGQMYVRNEFVLCPML